MKETGEAYVRALEWLLTSPNIAEAGFGGDLEDFAQYLCSSAGLWAQSHLAALPESQRSGFLQLVS